MTKHTYQPPTTDDSDEVKRAYRKGFEDGFNWAIARRQAPYNHKYWNKIAKFCQERAKWLEDWESRIVDNLVIWTAKGRPASASQVEKLQDFYIRCGGEERETDSEWEGDYDQ